MTRLPEKFGRLALILLLCLFIPGLVAGVLALAPEIGISPSAYIPAAMGGSGPSIPPPPPPASETLIDGEAVTGPDGLTLGVVSGTMTTTLQVTMTQISPPPEPLFAGATPRGHYYKIQLDQDFHAPLNKPFIAGLPVPTGVMTDQLGVAVLVPGQQVLDQTSAGPHWFPLNGAYDPVHDLFIVTVAGFTGDGLTFVLIEDAGLAPLQPVAAGNGAYAPETVTFLVQCLGFANPAKCGAADIAYVQGRLALDYGELIGTLNFEGPALKSQIGGLDPHTGLPTLVSYTAYYDIFIRPNNAKPCINSLGVYLPPAIELVMCKDPDQALGGVQTDRTVRHELFHAIQFAYPTVYNSSAVGWIMEGTASAAELSFGSMQRSPDFAIRPVDAALTMTETYAYQAQDFWVYLGLKNGDPLSYLQPLFESGADDEDAVDTFGDGEFLPPYWDWVKNQLMEKDINFTGTNPCSYEAAVVEDLEIFNHHWSDYNFHTVTLFPLDTIVVKVNFIHKFDGGDAWVFPTDPNQNPPAQLSLKYKFYVDGESGCQSVPDGYRQFREADGGIDPAKTYYVVISNIDDDGIYDYTIGFEVWPVPPS